MKWGKRIQQEVILNAIIQFGKKKILREKLLKEMAEEEEEREKQLANNRRKFYDELIATLPLEERWGLRLRNYQNFWYAEASLPQIITIQHTFEARPSDIFLVTQPKSGTTWLKALAFAIANRNNHDPSSKDHPLLISSPHDCVPFMFSYYDERSLLPSDNLSSLPSPRLLAFHFPYSGLPKSALDANCRIVYLSRDPKDCLVSHWHFFNKLRPSSIGPLPFSEAFELFSGGISTFGPVWDHYAEYLRASKRHPEKVMMLKYEELIKDGASNVKRLAEFIGCPFSKEEEERGVVEEIVKLCGFENLSGLEVNKIGNLDLNLKDVHTKNSYYFREGKSNVWRDLMSMEMAQKLDSSMEEKMKAT